MKKTMDLMIDWINLFKKIKYVRNTAYIIMVLLRCQLVIVWTDYIHMNTDCNFQQINHKFLN